MGPRLAILENVRGHLSLGFGTVLADLASVGWSARWGVVRASDAGACHQRARLFIFAYPESNGRDQGWTESARLIWGPDAPQRRDGIPAHTDSAGEQGSGRTWQDWRGVPGTHGLHLTTSDADLAGSQAWGTQPRRAPRQQATGQRQPMGRDAATSGRVHDPDAASSGRVRATQPENHDPHSGRGRGHDIAYLGGSSSAVDWGDYGPAIARWEHVIGRPAPAPTEPGRTGNPRLAPRFVEWMMGLPDGHVTDPAIGISRNDQLKALGNGVVPQQAALALRHLLAA
jgi:DNA (cytosine-5)-methyltransferase 1